MNDKRPTLYTSAGPSLVITKAEPEPRGMSTASRSTTVYTAAPPFETIKHALSGKPLRRPRRLPPKP